MSVLKPGDLVVRSVSISRPGRPRPVYAVVAVTTQDDDERVFLLGPDHPGWAFSMGWVKIWTHG